MIVYMTKTWGFGSPSGHFNSARAGGGTERAASSGQAILW